MRVLHFAGVLFAYALLPMWAMPIGGIMGPLQFRVVLTAIIAIVILGLSFLLGVPLCTHQMWDKRFIRVLNNAAPEAHQAYLEALCAARRTFCVGTVMLVVCAVYFICA